MKKVIIIAGVLFLGTANIFAEATPNDRAEYIRAAFADNLPRLKELVAAGVSANYTDENNRTALGYAIMNGNKEMVGFLLANGADVNWKDADGTTPLMSAAGHGKLDIIRLLLEKGADVNLKNNAGRNWYTFAKADVKGQIIDIVQKFIESKKAQESKD